MFAQNRGRARSESGELLFHSRNITYEFKSLQMATFSTKISKKWLFYEAYYIYIQPKWHLMGDLAKATSTTFTYEDTSQYPI